MLQTAYTFTASNVCGTEVELLPGGASLSVPPSRFSEYADMVASFVIHQFDDAVEAIRRGLACMVPARLLPLFVWHELEAMVCGAATIDVDALRAVTTYENGYSASDAPIKYFWEAFAKLGQEDRRRFVAFANGSSRLPRDLRRDSARCLKLTPLSTSRPADTCLPLSHACFFHVELPRYTSAEACLAKLLLAIHMQ